MAHWPLFFFDGENCSVDIDSEPPFIFDATVNDKEITINVRIMWSDIIFKLKVYPIYPITFIKRMIMVKEQVPVNRQIITYGGYKLAFEEEQTLQDFGIVSNDITIHMMSVRFLERHPPDYIKLKIKKVPGECLMYKNVPPGYTIHALKKMIQNKEGFQVQDVVLVYQEEDLFDENTLSYYSIDNNSLLHLGIIKRPKQQ